MKSSSSPKQINLIGTSIRRSFDIEKIARKVAPFSYGVLIISLILTSLTIIAFIFLGSSSKKNITKISSLKEEIKKLSMNESLLATIDDRTNIISSLFKSNFLKSDIFDDLNIILVPGFNISDFSLASGNLKVSGACSDNQCLTNLNERLEDLKQGKKFSIITLPNVDRSANISYNLSLEIFR